MLKKYLYLLLFFVVNQSMIGQVVGFRNYIIAINFLPIEKAIFSKWWFILSIIGILFLLINILFAKSSKYNKDFVRNYSKIESTNEQFTLYFLFLGIIIPVIDLVIEFTGVRERNTLEFNLITGFVLLLIYFLSKKYKIVYNNIAIIFSVVYILYGISTIFKIAKYHTSISSALEFAVMFFLSYTVFRIFKYYWIFVFSVVIIIFSLFFFGFIEKKEAVVFLSYSLLITVLNHIRHIVNLNSKDKFLFADNIVKIYH